MKAACCSLATVCRCSVLFGGNLRHELVKSKLWRRRRFAGRSRCLRGCSGALAKVLQHLACPVILRRGAQGFAGFCRSFPPVSVFEVDGGLYIQEVGLRRFGLQACIEILEGFLPLPHLVVEQGAVVAGPCVGRVEGDGLREGEEGVLVCSVSTNPSPRRYQREASS